MLAYFAFIMDCTVHGSFISVNQLRPLPVLLESTLTTHHGTYEPFSTQPSPYRWAFRLFLPRPPPTAVTHLASVSTLIHTRLWVLIRLFLYLQRKLWPNCFPLLLLPVICVFFPCI